MSELLGHVPALTEGEPDPIVTAWVAYTRHVRPPAVDNKDACGACIDAPKPGAGCEKGVALYDAYRAARIA